MALSIVGTEQLPENGYFRAKVAQENLIEKSWIPFSLVRATQFFEFTERIADEATDDGKVRVAPVLFQPIAGDDVAQAIGRVSVGEPLNGRVEVAGPEQFQMDEFFREVLAAWGDSREVVTDPHADYFGTELSERSLVPDDGAALGEIRYRDWTGRTSPRLSMKVIPCPRPDRPPGRRRSPCCRRSSRPSSRRERT